MLIGSRITIIRPLARMDRRITYSSLGKIRNYETAPPVPAKIFSIVFGEGYENLAPAFDFSGSRNAAEVASGTGLNT